MLYTMKEHKHWFQFVEMSHEGLARFVCLCGEQRIVETKKVEKPEEK